jgi:uncharacterized membrane protein YkvA (DUF1232 family)
MSLYLKIMLVLFGLAYLISPVDIIPDLLVPYVGWIDDSLVIFAIFHLIRHGELPWFLFKKKREEKDYESRGNQAGTSRNNNPGQAPYKNNGKRDNTQSGSGNGGPCFKSAHEILGVPANATWEEIQTSYKEKIKQYHPDKVSHLGEEFSHLANKKFLEIQKAYGTLKKQK